MSSAKVPPLPAPTPASATPPAPYLPPAIAWEQEFVALAQVSSPQCKPGDPPPCP